MMTFRTLAPSVAVLIGLAACSSESADNSTRTDPQTSKLVSIRVAGFVEAAGITWMGWPNKVKEALDGLQGVLDVQVDLEDDRFDVTYDAAQATVEGLLGAIRNLEFEPVVVKRASDVSKKATTRIDVSSLPADLSKLFADARDANKPVLLRFTGPGWPPCKQMDAVTYPDDDVNKELAEHWITTKIDVSEQETVATSFAVSAIPVAVAVSPEGEVLGRVLGFVDPEPFQKEISRFREGR